MALVDARRTLPRDQIEVEIGFRAPNPKARPTVLGRPLPETRRKGRTDSQL
jgi:hypothetical protein